MDLIRQVGEQVMVAEFLRAEIDSPRFGTGVRRALDASGFTEALLREPDLSDDRANAARGAILGRHRGYGRDREMFAGVPTDLAWYQATLSRDDVGALHYVDYSYWNELSGGTHLVRDGVTTIRAGTAVFGVPNEPFVDLAQEISAGRAAFRSIIFWGQDLDGPFELLEGHLRATALALAGESAPDRTPAIVGLVDPPLPVSTAAS